MPRPRVPQDEQAERRKQWRANNVEKRAAYIKAWRAKNKEHVEAYATAYQPSDASKELKRAYDKRYYEEVFKNDPEQVALAKERGKRWVAEHQDKVAANLQKYRETHREQRNEQNKAYYYGKTESQRKADRVARAEYQRQWRETNKEKLIEVDEGAMRRMSKHTASTAKNITQKSAMSSLHAPKIASGIYDSAAHTPKRKSMLSTIHSTASARPAVSRLLTHESAPSRITTKWTMSCR